MSNKKLTKYQALRLITPVVDGEATTEEREAFFAYIDENKEVCRKYKSVKNIKKLMRTRYPCSSAPPSLLQTVKNISQDNRGL